MENNIEKNKKTTPNYENMSDTAKDIQAINTSNTNTVLIGNVGNGSMNNNPINTNGIDLSRPKALKKNIILTQNYL